MRRVLPLLALFALAAPAAAATIRGTPRADSIQAAWGGVQGVRCGGGRDVVSADLSDRVARDCEVVSRRLSVDATANRRGQHETAVEPDSFASGSTVVAAFQVGRIAGGAAAAIGWATSTDAGRTWRRGILPSLTADSTPPGPETAASDPSVAYDATHGVWLVATLTLEPGTSHVLVARSADGLAWSAPATAATGSALDKDWIACDDGAGSPHRGRCYVAYSDDAAEETAVAWSDDGGATWSPPVRASSLLVGTQPVIRPDGTLVIVAGDYAGARGLRGSIDALVSGDGGATYTRVQIATLQAHPFARLRAIPLPSVAADGSGTIYAVWHDCRFRPGCTGNDLVLSTSADGRTWTAPSLIQRRQSAETFLPGLDADPSRPGRLGLVYAYFVPGSCAKGACLLGTAFVSSVDGGASWSAPQRLDATPMRLDWLARTSQGRMTGDYYSTSFAGGRVVPVFALAVAPRQGRFREAIFAASLPVAPTP